MEVGALETFFESQWNSAIVRYRQSLDQDDLETVQSFSSWSDVQIYILENAPQSIALIHPTLEHLNNFVNFFTKSLAASLDDSFFWGALACLLQVLIESEEPEISMKVPRMIKQLVHQAEAFNGLCGLVTGEENTIKEVCFDMQVLYLDFCIQSIQYIHHAGLNEDLQGSRSPLQLIERRYVSALQDLKEALNRVEKSIQTRSLLRVQSPQESGNVTPSAKPRCLMLPRVRMTRSFNREGIYERLDQILSPAAGKTFRSVALYGMGGVGKSTIASTYTKRKFEENVYDTVLWAYGEKPMSLRQSFTDIALRLKLPGAQAHNHNENLALVQDWFQSTDSNWLIVYDNVEDSNIITTYWPGSSHGKAIITTRNHSLAFEPASIGVEVPSWDAQTGSDFLLFLLKESIGHDLETESTSALALSERLSGHALALSHMAALIYEGEFSIQEFMKMYLKNPRRAHATNALSALWDFSFKSLDQKALDLLGVLCFLMPDGIPQDLFEVSDEKTYPKDLNFCSDEFTLSEVIRKLLSLALVKRERNTRTITIHRMVQTQFKQFLGHLDRQRCFNNAVILLCGAFPSEDLAKGQMYDRWQLCNQYVQHVLNIKDCFAEEARASMSFKAPWELCKLFSSCQRFLSETNSMAEVELVCEANLRALDMLEDGPKKMDMKASILSHEAQAAESLGNPVKAIELNHKGYQIRLAEKPRSKILLCYTANNLGYCHNTANLHETSEKWYEKSGEWWDLMVKDGEETHSRPARHITNHARCLIYLGKYDKAKEMLDSSIPRLKTEKPLNWAMLAYSFFTLATLNRRQRMFEAAEAQYTEAQNAWLKGDQARIHPFYAACLYKIGACCLDQGKVEGAIKNIRDSMEITKISKMDSPVEHARSLFKLSEALVQDSFDDSQIEALALREEAESSLKNLKPNLTALDTEVAYDNLVPIFWR